MSGKVPFTLLQLGLKGFDEGVNVMHAIEPGAGRGHMLAQHLAHPLQAAGMCFPEPAVPCTACLLASISARSCMQPAAACKRPMTDEKLWAVIEMPQVDGCLPTFAIPPGQKTHQLLTVILF